MKEVYVEYNATIEEWRECFKKGLEEHCVVYDEDMITNICRSLDNTIKGYLKRVGYRPKKSLLYKQGLVKKLEQNGMVFTIRTNAIFWKYLEYFTDLEDYSKGFDLGFQISDLELASKDLIFVAVNDTVEKAVVNHPLHSKEYADVFRKIEYVKTLMENDADGRLIKDMLKHIIEVLEYMIRSID